MTTTAAADVTFEQIYELALQLDSDERLRLIERLGASPSTLTAPEILDKLSENADALRELGVLKIGLFGSYARGEARTNSDIDILVALKPMSLFKGYLRVKHYLEDVLGREVDLVVEDGIKERIRPYIMDEVIYVEGF